MNRKTKPEKIIVDTIHWNRQTGDLETLALPVQVIDNAFIDGRTLAVRPVDKLAYEYNPSIFQEICKKFALSEDSRNKLKALIFLNSGYINPKLLRKHSLYCGRYENGDYILFYDRLADDLYKTQQAAPPPKGRKLYYLVSYKKPERLITKTDIKDVFFLLFLAVAACILLVGAIQIIELYNLSSIIDNAVYWLPIMLVILSSFTLGWKYEKDNGYKRGARISLILSIIFSFMFGSGRECVSEGERFTGSELCLTLDKSYDNTGEHLSVVFVAFLVLYIPFALGLLANEKGFTFRNFFNR